MGRIFHPLLFLLARCTKNELIRQVEFLKVEKEMLRKRVWGSCVRFNPEERSRLLSWARRLARASSS